MRQDPGCQADNEAAERRGGREIHTAAAVRNSVSEMPRLHFLSAPLWINAYGSGSFDGKSPGLWTFVLRGGAILRNHNRTRPLTANKTDLCDCRNRRLKT